MRKQKKGFTVVELVVVIAIIAVLAAVLIPTFTSIIKKANDSAYLQERTNQQLQDLIEKVENQNYLTWEDFEAKLAAAMADSTNDTSAKITEAVKNALSGISGASLTKEQVEKIVEKALEGQLTVTQVEAIVYNAIKGISVDGLTLSEVKAIVNNAIRNIPQTGVTKEQVTAAINSAIAGLTDAQKQAITAAVNSALEKFTSEAITAEDVQKIVEAVISGQSSKITLTLNKDNLSLNVGASETLVATVTPEGTEIGWLSSDTSIATVSNGTVTAVSAGNATITVTAGGATVTCAVTVVTAPVEVHLTGVVGYENQSDHYTDSNTLIGTWDANQQLTYYNSYYMLVHTLTVTYTIPADTPANATIICDPVTEWSEFLKDIWPGAGFGYTYKIVNNSSHVFNIKETNVHSDVVEAISKSNAIVKVGNDYKVLKNDNTYFDLDQCYIPNMTTCSYFNNYITWLKTSGATTESSATSTFMGEYFNTFANSSDKSFYYYLDTEVVQKGTSWDEILDVLCGSPDSSAGNITYNNKKAQYVECELIRLMMKFSYEKAFGFVFVQNTENGWRHGAYQKIYNNNVKVDFGTGFYGWDTCEPTTLKAYNFLELCEDGATLNYLKNGNTISGGIACLWHVYAGNAWQEVTLCDAPQFTIMLEAN